MLLLEEALELAIALELVELLLEGHLLEVLVLDEDGLLAGSHPLHIHLLQLVLLPLRLSLLVLPGGEVPLLRQHLLHLGDHALVAALLRLLQRLLQRLESLILVVFDEGVALGEEALVQGTSLIIETRVTGEV